MIDSQNEFYSSISKYYSEIFPYNPMQLSFVKKELGNLQGKTILDIGCATGELAFGLTKAGAQVTGIDLNEDLLEQARAKMGSADVQSSYAEKNDSKIAPLNPAFRKGNMLELKADFSIQSFDTVLCFGNTLVHLNSVELIEKMLEGVKAVLKPGGQLFIQILNYDYIVGEQISALPVIETDNIQFVRRYNFRDDSDLIDFITVLKIKTEGNTVSNKTPLLALKSSHLIRLLENSGFRDIRLFASFKQEPFGGKHIPLVVSCVS